MPIKKNPAGREYEVKGKSFLWFPLDDDDQPVSDPVTIPLRLKVGTIRKFGATADMDIEKMFSLVEAIIPDQSDALAEMDLNDFSAMFVAWQREYELLSGASLGESSGSSS